MVKLWWRECCWQLVQFLLPGFSFREVPTKVRHLQRLRDGTNKMA
jgi:hypothetical protein